mgnify:CR=1 FL=1
MAQYGALEAGGTKMVLSILDEVGNMLERTSLPTETPDITMPAMIDFFRAHPVASLGIGCFGPIDLDEKSDTYGHITATPKLPWRFTPILSTFQEALNIPVKIDTDVNAAALAESKLGAAKGLGSCLYVTIGTGVGGGVVIGGKCVHGLIHPELGHQIIRSVPNDPMPDGCCPYHKGCLEGLASGTAIGKRWNEPSHQLPPDHPAWDMEANYLAQMCVNAMMTFSPEKIILGGGVMQQSFLFPLIRIKTLALLGNYLCHQEVDNQLEDYIVPPGLGIHSGVMGAYLLAREAAIEAGKA